MYRYFSAFDNARLLLCSSCLVCLPSKTLCSAIGAIRASISCPKDNSKCRLDEPGFEPMTFQYVDVLHLLIHSYSGKGHRVYDEITFIC